MQATQLLLNDEKLDHEYLPITGLPAFTSAAAKLILGADSAALKEGRVARYAFFTYTLHPARSNTLCNVVLMTCARDSVQTISGTGANHLGALFLSRFYGWNGAKRVYLSDPTWGVCVFFCRS